MKFRNASLALATVFVAVSPALASAVATDTKNTTISATVDPTISMTTSGTVTLTLTPTSGSVQSIGSDTVTVNSNSTSGYNLKLRDSDAVLNLGSSGNTITPTSGTFAAPAALSTDGKWGFAIAGAPFDASYTTGNNGTTFTAKFAAIAATDVTLKSTGGVASNDTTTVYYGARVGTSQPTGTYTDSVTYTATTN